MDFKRKEAKKGNVNSLNIDEYRKQTIEQYNVEPGETRLHEIYEVMSKSDDIKEYYMAHGVKYACDFINDIIGKKTDSSEFNDTEIVDDLYTTVIEERNYEF